MDVAIYFCIFYNLSNVQRSFTHCQAVKKKRKKKERKRIHVQRKAKPKPSPPCPHIKARDKRKKALTKEQSPLHRQTLKKANLLNA